MKSFAATAGAAVSLFVQGALAGEAVWQNTQCGLISIDRIDTIVDYNLPGGHLHDFFGASGVSMNATYQSLTESSCNTCGIKEDNSVYWMPAIYFWKNDNTYSPLANTGSIAVYYKMNFDGQTVPPGYFSPFPEGFQMVTGNPTLRTCSIEPGGSPGLFFKCNGDDDQSSYTAGFPVNKKCSTITAAFNLPWCWNGETTSPDHSSHVAYPTNYLSNNEFVCPPTHNKSLPVPFIEHDFNASMFQDLYSSAMYPEQPFVFSFGDPTGCGIHADFQNGWDFEKLSYVMENYHIGQTQDPTSLGWLTSAHPNCPMVPAQVHDDIGTPGQWLTELPGGIQAGGAPLGVAQNPNAPTAASGGSAPPAASGAVVSSAPASSISAAASIAAQPGIANIASVPGSASTPSTIPCPGHANMLFDSKTQKCYHPRQQGMVKRHAGIRRGPAHV